MEWWVVLLIATVAWLVSSVVFALLVGKVLRALGSITAEMGAMEERRRERPPRDTVLRVPYRDRLRAEYERRGIPWVEPKVTTTDG
jgi:hypothetical protein